jgi:hypothetical protein
MNLINLTRRMRSSNWRKKNWNCYSKNLMMSCSKSSINCCSKNLMMTRNLMKNWRSWTRSC